MATEGSSAIMGWTAWPHRTGLGPDLVFWTVFIATMCRCAMRCRRSCFAETRRVREVS